MNVNDITLIIPSHNNLQYLKNAYASVRKFYPNVQIIVMDDASTDGTLEWLVKLPKQKLMVHRHSDRRGHTILYDKGIELADTPIVGILHADMIVGPNYLENMLKHLKRGTVVCATRVEPPLHPPGIEKIIRDFGQQADDLNIDAFEDFCITNQEYRPKAAETTKGMFAPWIIYKKDFQTIGGHDPVFAPFPYEDSDIFQRWLLAGYELVQSRDSFVYHLTCRGHRWTKEIGKNDDYFIAAEINARRNYMRKWGRWIQNDENQHPIVPKVYDIGFVVHTEGSTDILRALEPLCTDIYIQVLNTEYLREQVGSIHQVDLALKIHDIETMPTNDIVVHIHDLDNDIFKTIQQIPYILDQHEDGPGNYTLISHTLTLQIKNLKDYSKDLIYLL